MLIEGPPPDPQAAEELKRLQLTPEERAKLFQDVAPIDAEAWQRECPPSTPEELAEMEEWLREREAVREAVCKAELAVYRRLEAKTAEVTVSEGPDDASRITVDPQQYGGRPCIRGMRIRVADVLGLYAAGLGPAEILEEMPDLEPEDLRAALSYAVRRMEQPALEA